MYRVNEELAGVWGLRQGFYTAEEVEHSDHLRAAVNAKALIAVEDGGQTDGDMPEENVDGGN